MGPNAIIVVAAVLAIVGGGVAVAMAGNDEPAIPDVITLEPAADQQRVGATPTDAGASADDPAAAGEGSTPAADRETAERQALDAVGGGQVIDIRRDVDDRDYGDAWDVKVRYDGRIYDVDVDMTGRVVDFEADDDRPTSHASLTVDRSQAERAAVDAAGGGTVRASDLDDDDGRPEWEVVVIDEAGRWIEIVVDATDGRVIEQDVED
jgi:uncharacterized membrane protein YkoI